MTCPVLHLVTVEIPQLILIYLFCRSKDCLLPSPALSILPFDTDFFCALSRKKKARIWVSSFPLHFSFLNLLINSQG